MCRPQPQPNIVLAESHSRDRLKTHKRRYLPVSQRSQITDVEPTVNAKDIIIIFFFTLGIKDPEGFGKKIRRKCVGVTITPGSP